MFPLLNILKTIIKTSKNFEIYFFHTYTRNWGGRRAIFYLILVSFTTTQFLFYNSIFWSKKLTSLFSGQRCAGSWRCPLFFIVFKFHLYLRCPLVSASSAPYRSATPSLVLWGNQDQAGFLRKKFFTTTLLTTSRRRDDVNYRLERNESEKETKPPYLYYWCLCSTAIKGARKK